MNKIFSQKEIDKLLNALQEIQSHFGKEAIELLQSQIPKIKSLEDERINSQLEVEKIFAQFHKTTEPYILTPALSKAYELLQIQLCIVFSKKFNDFISVGEVRTEKMKYGECINKFPCGDLFVVVKSPSFETPLLITLDQKLVFLFVDLLLGQQSLLKKKTHFKIDLSPIELSLLEVIVQVITLNLKSALKQYCNFSGELQIERMETNPLMLGLSLSSDEVVVSSWDVESKYGDGVFQIIVPINNPLLLTEKP